MKIYIFLICAFLCSCKKDIGLMDKKNDCKDCVLVGFNFQGDFEKVTRDFYYNSGRYLIASEKFYNFTYCEYIDYVIKNSNSYKLECR